MHDTTFGHPGTKFGKYCKFGNEILLIWVCVTSRSHVTWSLALACAYNMMCNPLCPAGHIIFCCYCCCYYCCCCYWSHRLLPSPSPWKQSNCHHYPLWPATVFGCSCAFPCCYYFCCRCCLRLSVRRVNVTVNGTSVDGVSVGVAGKNTAPQIGVVAVCL